MKRFKNYIVYFPVFILFLVIYKVVFINNPISGGDYESFPISIINFFKNYAFASWENKINLGWSNTGLLHGAPINFVYGWIGFILYKNISISERLVWWLPFIFLSFISIIILTHKVFNNVIIKLFSIIVFSFNTYILLTISGGQIAGIGLAYSLTPLTIYSFIRMVEDYNLKYLLIFSLFVSLELIFDLRTTYILLVGIYLYFIICLSYEILEYKSIRVFDYLKRIILFTIVPGVTVFLLQSYWLIPMAVYQQNPLQQFGSAYTSFTSVKFFSFSRIENSISLLHPNWPENIFGLTHFMRPEFILLPILAFSSLLFLKRINKQQKLYILYFALLALIGAFLAKGANDPFGFVYLWMFAHIPGFIMFRDPTKWYLLVAISYSMLIPFTIWQVYQWLKCQNKVKILNLKYQLKSKSSFINLQNVFLFAVFVYLLFLIRPALLGQLSGTFRSTPVPNDYIKLQKYLSSQNNYSRTLWMPVPQRFGYYSNTHPEISAEDFYKVYNPALVVNQLKSVGAEKQLQEAGVEYIIVPYDSEGEIFLNNRKYDAAIYNQTIAQIAQISWLHDLPDFGKIKVFKLSGYKQHFWSPDKVTIQSQFISPVKYKVNITNSLPGDKLVFAENYDPHWELIGVNKQSVYAKVYNARYNSFIISGNGEYMVYYTPQIWVDRGLIISMISLISIIILLIYSFIRSYQTRRIPG